MRRMSQVTRILERAQAGDPHAADQLLPLVYNELRKLAARQMASQPAGHTLQPTALVHEAWLRLAGSERDRWNDRRHFFRAAAQAMRQILVDAARKKSRFKRGGGWRRLDLESIHLAVETDPDGLLAVNEALEDLSSHDPVKADLVKLRFFVGLTLCEAAQALGCSTATAKRSWAFARAWLYRRLTEAGEIAQEK
jgi:RNA polymerase sigma factor (TIGR02999 family)